VSSVSKPFVPPVSPRLRAVAGRADHLLSVRQVAERLGVSTATVYALCDRGELLHVRVSNAIRVLPADLQAFLGAGRRGGEP
jgi:excisionase family DNA binding protein